MNVVTLCYRRIASAFLALLLMATTMPIASQAETLDYWRFEENPSFLVNSIGSGDLAGSAQQTLNPISSLAMGDDGIGHIALNTDGLIDKVSTSDMVLTEDELLVRNLVADLQGSLVAWWPLDGNAVDASGNGKDGQVHGPAPCQDRFGNPASAMCFDGDLAHYINIGNRVKPPFPFTITAWVKPETIGGDKWIIRNDLWANYYHGAVVNIVNGRLYGSYGDGGWNAPWSRTGALTKEVVMVAGDWQHVAVVFNAHRDVRIYQNCMEHQVVYDNGTGSSMRYSTANGAMGSGSPLVGNSRSYSGAMDDVRVYNRALSSVEIATVCQYVPDSFGDTLQTRSSYEFSIERGAQQTRSIQLINPGDVSRSATLDIANPYGDLSVTLQSSNPITVAPGTTESVPLVIDADGTAVGVYEGILLEVAVDDGSTLYSNITVYVTAPGAADQPDLSISADDIGATSGDPVTLTATVRNRGSEAASNIEVEFYEFDTSLGSAVISNIPAGGSGTASLTVPLSGSGDHLIEVVVDTSGSIDELDESNNEASQIISPGGGSGAAEGRIRVSGSRRPSTVYTDRVFALTGQAVYDITADGTQYTNYVVKGGSVAITIEGNGDKWTYGNVYTDVNGQFTKSIRAPATPGDYQIFMTVTDKTFTGTGELVFSTTEAPASPPPPPPPPTSGTGDWTPEGRWTPGPGSGPVPESDVWVYAEDVYFSENNPSPSEEITVFAEIRYWATSTDRVAESIPVNVYVTDPGEPWERIGQTQIESLSVGAPDFGSRYVYATWKNPGGGIYILEVEIDPSYTEDNTLNNAATRAIIVGQSTCNQGAVSGQVTDVWGGVENVTISVYNASDELLGSTLTDATGFYLIEDVVGTLEVRIEPPTGYSADDETRSVQVAACSVSEVDFYLSEQVDSDTQAPQCEIQAINPGPPVTLEVLTRDTDSGLSAITVLERINAAVTIPTFTPGTTEAVIVTAEKIDPDQSSQVKLEVADEAGNVTVCDPIIVLVVRDTGKPVTETVTGVPDGEEIIVTNGDPGLKNLEILVNGTKFKVTGLKDGKTRAIDASAALVEGENTFELTAKGKPGTSAVVTIPVE